jgi:capsular polysaccharide export protein
VACRPARRRRAAAAACALADGRPYFLLPLQLDSDSQVRLHSKFGGMTPVIADIIQSFARHSAGPTALVVKEHPLDDGLVDWRRLVTRLATEAGIANRVIYLEMGDLDPLIRNASGVVTVNSTTGTLALAHGVPVITLGTAIYDIVGLTHQDTLDSFWTAPTPPDVGLYDAFLRVLSARCLLVGNFFSEAGINLLVEGAVQRLESEPLGHAVAIVAASAEADCCPRAFPGIAVAS